jgi:hypothetical protein
MDYRYFPDPDLPPLMIAPDFISERAIAELPMDRRMKYLGEYKLIEDDARILSGDRMTSDFYEELVEITGDAKKSCSYITTILFAPQRGRHASLITPSSSLLVDSPTPLIDLTLTSKLDIDRSTNRGESVDIFEFDTIAESRLSDQSHRYIDITPELSFFHIGIRGSAPSHQFLELFEVGEDICPRAEVWLRDDLHQWGTSSVVVTECTTSCMDELASVVLDMHMMDAEYSIHPIDDRPDLASHRYRLIELSDLVSHREIRIKVALAIKHTRLHHCRSECMPSSDSEIDDSG